MKAAQVANAEAGTDHSAVFARMRRNVAWLFGGRGFQAAASILYLGFAARALGLHGFGEFSLALAYGQAVANIAQFQSWQGVIRYGAVHLQQQNRAGLARLLGFTATLDVASALTGALLAACGVWLLGPWLGWSVDQQMRAGVFGAALLLSIGATPTGALRLYDRFGLIAGCQAIGPALRLVGSAMAWSLGGGIGAFLAVWAAAALVQNAATWWVAIRWSGGSFAISRSAFADAIAENRGIRRYMLATNASSSLGLLIEQVSTLAVGGAAGASAAGAFRLASKLATALARPVQAMSRVLYPELARLLASRNEATLHAVMRRADRVALGLAIVVVVIAAAGGPLILQLLAGRAYRQAHSILLLLAIGAAIDLSGFALEPLLAARGAVVDVLRARIAGGLVYVALLAALVHTGSMGVAAAMVGASLAVRLLLGRFAARGFAHEPSPLPEPTRFAR